MLVTYEALREINCTFIEEKCHNTMISTYMCGGEWINQCILSLRLFTKRKIYIYIYCTAIHRPLVLMCRRGTTSLLDMFLTERLHRTEDSSTWFWPFHAELPDEIHQPRRKASAGDLGPLYVHDWSQLQQ